MMGCMGGESPNISEGFPRLVSHSFRASKSDSSLHPRLPKSDGGCLNIWFVFCVCVCVRYSKEHLT